MGNLALVVDKATHLYITIQTVDNNGTANGTGYPDVIYPFHLKSMGVISDKSGMCIALNITRGFGVSAGRNDLCDYIIPFGLLYSYNGNTNFTFLEIYNDINACIKGEEGGV